MPNNLARRGATHIRESARVLGHQTLRYDAIGLDDVVRRLRAGLSGLTDTDHHFLHDISRGQYSTTWLSRLTDLSARAETDEAAYAIVELLRAAIASRRAQFALPIEAAIDAEDAAQHAEDDAVRQYERTKSLADRERMREAVHAHEIALGNLHRAASTMADEGIA